MWATFLTPVGPFLPAPIPKPTKHLPATHFPLDFSANSRLRRGSAASNGGGDNNPKQEDGKEISGSDVLWALQRAAAQRKKKKNKRKKKGLTSSDVSQREKDGIDYNNIRPLEIKTEWSLKLDELEKRLQELEDAT